MNVIFHTATAISIVALITDTKRVERVTIKNNLYVAVVAFLAGVIAHGILDYMPHCYPITSKLDATISLLIMITFILLANRNYRLLLGFAFMGCIFPDLIDLSPGILNRYLGLNLSVPDKIFPWHRPRYSGSIYDNACSVSILNHSIVVIAVVAVCWLRRTDLRRIFRRTTPLDDI